MTTLDDLPGAMFSPDLKYRYFLQRQVRQWPRESKGTCGWFLLNGSKAGEEANDPTVMRLFSFTQSWGYGRFLLANINGLAATDPKELYHADDPVGPENDTWIDFVAKNSDIAICGWGNHGLHLNRGQIVGDRLVANGIDLYCLPGPDGEPLLTQKRQPRHPLYLKGSRVPEIYRTATPRETRFEST